MAMLRRAEADSTAVTPAGAGGANTSPLVSQYSIGVDGKLTALSPEVLNGQVVARVRFDGDTPAALRQNQRVSVRIVLDERDGVLTVQRGPFLEAGGGRLCDDGQHKGGGRHAEQGSYRTDVSHGLGLPITAALLGSQYGGTTIPLAWNWG